VVPIGFGGMRGAIHAMLHLKRPRLTMNIGTPIPPVKIVQKDISRKEALVSTTRFIMERIQELIPAEEFNHRKTLSNQHYELDITMYTQERKHIDLPEENKISHSQELAQFFMQPVILDVFVHNLKLPAVRPLQNLNHPYPAIEIQHAVQAVLDYLEINRGFLTYRFGMETGLAMQSGLRELYALSAWAAKANMELQLTPIRTYTDADGISAIEKGSRPVEHR
jgi:hypothetical protein